MTHRPTMDATLNAYRTARTLADAAAAVEHELLHAAAQAAQEAGKSVRETAALLQVPKSTVGRHRLGAITPFGGSTWLTPETYVAAHNAAWAGEPSQHIDAAPFLLEMNPDGSRRFAAVPASGHLTRGEVRSTVDSGHGAQEGDQHAMPLNDDDIQHFEVTVEEVHLAAPIDADRQAALGEYARRGATECNCPTCRPAQ